jgi:hypothetical protein
MRQGPVAVIALFAFLLPTTVHAQPAPAPRPLTRQSLALVVTYADGRVTHELVSDKPASAWTPNFPRTTEVSTGSGVQALQVSHARVGDDVRVTVSLLSGRGIRTERVVTPITVSRSGTVSVDRLRDFGVEPVVLSLIDATTLTPFVPAVVSVSSDIEISRVDLLTAPSQGYRITVRNLASQAVALFSVQSYRGPERALSRVARGDRGRPAMAPGEARSFDLPITAGRGYSGATLFVPEPLDVIEIDEVLWEDGTSIGRRGANPLGFGIASDGGRRLQFERALQVLRGAQRQQSRSVTDLLSLIRHGFEGIPETDDTRLEPARQTMQATRAMVLRDLDAFEASPVRDAAEVRLWIQKITATYEARLKQLAA